MNNEDSLRMNLEAIQHAIRMQRLRSMKWLALGFLFAAIILYVAAQLMLGKHPVWRYVAAFSEAAMVGAIADWFAVVALFRYPLGLPIWHTAIIPNSKQEIARNIGTFITTHFVTVDGIVSRVRDSDPVGKLAGWLIWPENGAQLGKVLAEAAVMVVGALDDASMRGFVRDNIRKKLENIDVSGMAGEVLKALAEEKKHQDLLDNVLRAMSEQLDNPDSQGKLRALVNQVLDLDSVKILGMEVGGAMRNLAARAVTHIVNSLQSKAAEVQADAQHPWRAQFDFHVDDFILHLKADPVWRGKIDQAMQGLLTDPQLNRYLEQLWDDAKARILDDIQRQDSATAGYLGDAALALGRRLAADSKLQDWANEQILKNIPPLVEKYRGKVAGYITQEIELWSRDEMTDRIELALGPDLQFIRINGTLVGGLAGLLIYSLTHLFAT
ncbi:DUF445 domain-containing protein [Undibacterium sp.]|uniref:DUF445 domain-containing protein n=1 Tax=Undibacterium sp. TaxID=1914977 RepID=UPI002C778726|nr:DUF445 domain-containing protein [Undibacterium sp.]HTD03141.1 DUF445 domain-containing protein [Undibacterium sp.]